jgi:quercetin dioxygenase-like cupin family protein
MSSESHGGTYISPGQGESVWLVGDLLTVKVASEDTDGPFTIVEESTPPQGGPPPHLHQQAGEVLYVLEEEVEFLVGERTIRAGTGSCAYIHEPTKPSHVCAMCGWTVATAGRTRGGLGTEDKNIFFKRQTQSKCSPTGDQGRILRLGLQESVQYT